MLGKLMKYEIKATARWFLPLYTVILVIAAISRLLFGDPLMMESSGFTFRKAISILVILAYVILVVGVMIVTLVVCIIRFYKSLLGDEGYLMFTLPVQTWKHITGKLLIAVLWSFLSGLFACLSIFIIIPSPELLKIRQAFAAEFSQFFNFGSYCILSAVVIVSLVFSILQIYAAIALGHLFNKHRLLASFGMYIAINTVCQYVTWMVTPLLVGSVMKFDGNLELIVKPVSQTFILFTVVAAILSAGCFVLTNILLKKNLNLE
jgi:hypothetical protein